MLQHRSNYRLAAPGLSSWCLENFFYTLCNRLKSFFVTGSYSVTIGFELINTTVNNNVKGLLAMLETDQIIFSNQMTVENALIVFIPNTWKNC